MCLTASPSSPPSSPRPSTSRRSLLRTALIGATGLAAGAAALSVSAAPASAAGIHGQDVSGWQGTVDWPAQKDLGSRFAYCKATEGTGYRSPDFNSQYTGSYDVGLAHGAYHFARPDQGDPIQQADFFLNNGGGWSDDGRTLPGLLDVEGYPNLPADYGLSQADLRSWIAGFCDHYREQTGRRPMIYTNAHWYNDTVGAWTPPNIPLHLAAYQDSPPTLLAARWWAWEMWQYSDRGTFAGDSNLWRGDEASFEAFLADPDYEPAGI